MKCMVQCFQNTLKNPLSSYSIIQVKYSGYYLTGILKQPIFWGNKRNKHMNKNSYHNTETLFKTNKSKKKPIN